MRLLITTDIVGGVWGYTLTLVQELIGRGHRCLVAVIGDDTDRYRAELPAGAEHEAIPLRLEWMKDPWADVCTAVAWLQRLERRWQPDVLHFNQYAYAAAIYGARKLVVAHSDVLSWWGEVVQAPAPPEWAEYTAWVRAGLLRADGVVAPSSYQSRLLARHYGRPADVVIPNGIRVPAVVPGKPASRRGRVLTAGRAWDVGKSTGTLDHALERMGEAAPRSYLAGPLHGPDGDVYRPRRLIALGDVPRSMMGELYTDTAVYVATSRYEPFGLGPLEAAAHGCALLLSDLGSLRTLWNRAAAFYRPGDAAGLAAALTDLLRDPAHIDALAAGAQQRVLERFTAARMAERYERLYRSLIDGDPLIGGRLAGAVEGAPR